MFHSVPVKAILTCNYTAMSQYDHAFTNKPIQMITEVETLVTSALTPIYHKGSKF
jgi:hypothetical protein